MNHLNEDKLLEYLLETSTDTSERAKITEHLSACPECRRLLEDIRDDIEIIGGVRPLRPVLRIPYRRVSRNLVYQALRIAALIIFGIAIGSGGSKWISRQPATVSPAYVKLSPPPDSVSSYVVADATMISTKIQ
jgi:predicted anti-sigma-YlaC factor YlaD